MKNKKLFLLILILILQFCVIGLVACNSVSLETIQNQIIYTVGDNVDVFDLFTYEDNQTYSFKYTFEGKVVDVEGETIYLAKNGEYSITATATKGNSQKTATVNIKVVDGLATMNVKNPDIVVGYEDSMSVRALIGRASIAISIKADYTTYIESVIISKSDEESISYDLVRKIPEPGIDDSVEYNSTPDGFFNGKTFKFIYECDYTFTIATITSGGVVTATLNVAAIESFSGLTLLEGLNFDKETLTATWDSVEGATTYRVKAGNQAVKITETTYNIKELLPNREFQFFNLAVIPETESGEKLGVMLIEDVIIAPEGSENVVVGAGATIDAKTKEVTLIGGESFSAGWMTGVRLLNNSHIAFYGDYGIGTYVEFLFKGNNLPQVCFFANNINGNMTEEGGSGYILMNGLYTPNKGESASTTQVVGENRLIVLGPNRLGTESSSNYLYAAEAVDNYLMSQNTLFTQKALNSDTSGRTYRYVVGSINMGGLLGFEATLYNAETDEIVVEPTVFVTNTKAEDAPKGHIIAYATVKGNGNNTVFSYDKLPYTNTEKTQTDYYNLLSYSQDNGITTVSLKGTYSKGGLSWYSGINKSLYNSYTSLKGNYGVGTYIDFTFKGNNLPQVCLFANNINGNMSQGGDSTTANPINTGYLLTNGLYATHSGNTQVYDGDKLLLMGPYRMDPNCNYNKGWQAIEELAFKGGKLFGQNNLEAETSYKYTVGSYADRDGKIIIEAKLSNFVTNEVYASVTKNTGRTKAEVEALGGNILLYACVKGETEPTTFSFCAPYQVEKDGAGVTYNSDGSVSLESRYPMEGISWFSGINQSLINSYVAFEGNYGVGTYIDFTFKGNNLPQVCLFANNINGNMSQGGETTESSPVNTGYLIMNGLYGSWNGDAVVHDGDKLLLMGPYRMDPTNNYRQGWQAIEQLAFKGGKLFGQNNLDSDLTYKYTVGSYANNAGNVIIEVTLANATTSVVYATATIDTGKTKTEVELLGGNIIAYGCVKGGVEATTFFFSLPYENKREELKSSGAEFNNDGTVSLENRYPTNGISWFNDINKSFDNSYIAFEGNYGVGTYIDFTFKGNNLPQVCLFANNINGNMSRGGETSSSNPENNGYIIMNGFYGGTTAYDTDKLLLMGPNRMDGTCNYTNVWQKEAALSISGGKYFAQKNLDANTTYKYTVGSYVDTDGKVVIDVTISNAETSEVIKQATKSTGKTKAEVEALGGNIIAYGCVKGGTDATTFKYSTPYIKNA